MTDIFAEAFEQERAKNNDAAAEYSVIGSLLIEYDRPEKLAAIFAAVESEKVFYNGKTREIYITLKKMYEAGEKIDLITAADKMPQYKDILAECGNITPTAANVEAYIKILHDKYVSALRSAYAQTLAQFANDPVQFAAVQERMQDVLSQFEQPKEQKKVNPLLYAIKSFANFELKEVEWLVPGKIQKGALNALVGDGGTGKSALASDLAAAISAGKKCVLDDGNPEYSRTAQMVIYVTAEESGETVLRRRFERMGGNKKSLYLMEQSILDSTITAEKKEVSVLESCAVNSPYLLDLIRTYKPALLVIDPLQSFVPAGVNMFSRNEARSVLNPLAAVAAECNTAVLVLMHTNKRSGVSGRNRMADSADIWDIMRSVIITGKTQDGTFYASPEKSNNAMQRETTIFEYVVEEDGGTTPIQFVETSYLHDRDYQHNQAGVTKQDNVEDDILTYLADGENGRRTTADLDKHLIDELGHSKKTVEKAKTSLAKQGKIESINTGYGGNKRWYTQIHQDMPFS